MTPARLVIGKINGAFGVCGQVKIFSYTHPKEKILSYAPWWLETDTNGWVACRLTNGRQHNKAIIAQLDHCTSRDQALALVGKQLAIDLAQLPETDHGEFYWLDLIGLCVVNTQGLVLGKVDRLLETGANDVLVVNGEKERLIPYIWDQVIRDVNIKKNQITVDWDKDF